MNIQVQKQYVLADIMKKRRKNQEVVQNKIKSKIAIKSKRKKNKDALKGPQKFIKKYRAEQKSYAHYRLKNKKNVSLKLKGQNIEQYGVGKILLVVRIRGVTDISAPQRHILNKINLRKINTAVFLKNTEQNVRQLKKVENYITWGQPSKKLINQLIYKKLYGKVQKQRVHIKSNAQVQQYIGGDVICLEDIINQIENTGKNFQKIINFIFPFKLTTPEGTLASRFRKPVTDNGHWGYRGQAINQYVELMI